MKNQSVSEQSPVDRRKALMRLGLGAAAVYVAPTVLHLDRSAQAVQPSCNSKGKAKGNPWCGGSSKGKSKGKGK